MEAKKVGRPIQQKGRGHRKKAKTRTRKQPLNDDVSFYQDKSDVVEKKKVGRPILPKGRGHRKKSNYRTRKLCKPVADGTNPKSGLDQAMLLHDNSSLIQEGESHDHTETLLSLSFEDYSPWPSPIHMPDNLSILEDVTEYVSDYGDYSVLLAGCPQLLSAVDESIDESIDSQDTQMPPESVGTWPSPIHVPDADTHYSLCDTSVEISALECTLNSPLRSSFEDYSPWPSPIHIPDNLSILEDENGYIGNDGDCSVLLDSSTAQTLDVSFLEARQEDEIKEVIASQVKDPYEQLQHELSLFLASNKDNSFVLIPGNKIQIVKHYNQSEVIGVQYSVNINESGEAEVVAHRRRISWDHDIWLTLPKLFTNISDVRKLLNRLLEFDVCIGNYEQEMVKLIPEGAGLSYGENSGISAYREGDFGATCGNHRYSTTIRAVKCDMLVKVGVRCKPCQLYRNTLRKKLSRARAAEKKTPCNPLSWKKSHAKQTKDELITKLESYKKQTKTMQDKIERLERQFSGQITSRGESLTQTDNEDMLHMMSEYSNKVENAFQDPTSHQRLFWDAQKKHNSLRSKKSMRWHPAIIKWCIYMRSKSSTAYDSMRRSGFVALPSERTLYDYTHAMPSKLGFRHEYEEHLIQEATAKGLYEDASKGFVGLLQDEMKVKEDLVYDRVSGELVGYVDIDKCGNQLADFEETNEPKRKLAKSVLVLMVRGLTSNLKYPLAVFATNSVTSDVLYPIIWKAVKILEINCQLKVLCITCDGATPNRKFFKLHKTEDHHSGPVYWTINRFSSDKRKIYFISDVPHLIKTARNCFANSFSHKRSRRLWKGGKDISWGHIQTLYEQHVEPHLYTYAHKLTRAHIDLTAFSQMKVNLAAQVLSKTVADALELHFDERQSETVKFIRHMNKFFDCLNTRSMTEATTRRIDDLASYTEVDDDRLQYLEEEFLGYFDEWRDEVMARNGPFTQVQRSTMMLSHQTLDGLKISVKSIVECVRYLLQSGARHVLTHKFNQDPLEQHFSHHRHKGGGNDNPTVNDVRHNINSLRVVGSHALAPLRANVKGFGGNTKLDDTPLPRRVNKRQR